ncbi:MAG: hypothetical protein VX320_05745 [Candidatus Thermoplasmatota archaeon]|nr:hypothetical protein [Candidatus Thermoplasmatota archaeon]MEE3083567.1 hypothetical protein [Candidatus Thermoplasmatota archaeon]
MIELDGGIAQQLAEEATPSSAIQVRVGTSNSFLVIASILQPLIQGFQMRGVYICASRSASEIIQTLDEVGIDSSGIQFIDTVSSGFIGGTESPYPNIRYVDSPIMLESIMLQTLYHLQSNTDTGNFVMLDSVNALSIYNDERMLAEYLHTFINTFRAREVLTAIVNVPDQTPPGVLANLDLYCTDLIDRGQVVIH